MVQYGYSYGNLAKNTLTTWQKPDKQEHIPHPGSLEETPPPSGLAYELTPVCHSNVLDVFLKVLFLCPSTKLEPENL